MPNNIKSEDFLELLQSVKRGRLKVYIGSVAGVGKTYRMLQEAHALKTRGADVVLGYIEPHTRPETQALIEGLEVVPRRKYEYRSVIVEEMDLDAVLARKPQIVIVDELAHTNVPLCRNQKRYQDVVELLLAGINVICAFNIQHLESLNDIIYDVTGVKVYETLPDAFLKKADQVVNIDLSVEDLIDRLKSGKIYPAERINIAMENFFRNDNLGRLRELALREVAETLDRSSNIGKEKKEEAIAQSSASDKLMVCLKPEKFSQKSYLRKASRIAGKLNTNWFVVYVETQKDRPENIDSEKQRYLFGDIQLAKDLGAQFVHIKGEDRTTSWLKYAEDEHIAHIAIAKEQNVTLLNKITRNNIFDKMLNHSSKFDIYLISMHQQKEELIDKRS